MIAVFQLGYNEDVGNHAMKPLNENKGNCLIFKKLEIFVFISKMPRKRTKTVKTPWLFPHLL